MVKFRHKIILPVITLPSLLSYLRGKGFDCVKTSVQFSDFDIFTQGDEATLVGAIITKTYVFKVMANNAAFLDDIDLFMETPPIKHLTAANWEPELRDMLATDKSFLEAVKRLQHLWLIKGQPLDPLEATPEETQFSPRYNIYGSEGQLMADIPNVAQTNAGE